jgi:hypothetical protein
MTDKEKLAAQCLEFAQFTVVGTIQSTTFQRNVIVSTDSVLNKDGLVNDDYSIADRLTLPIHLFPDSIAYKDRVSVKFIPYVEESTGGVVFRKEVTVFNEKEKSLEDYLQFSGGYKMGFKVKGEVTDIFQREKFDVYEIWVENISLMVKAKHENPYHRKNCISVEDKHMVFNDAKGKFQVGDHVVLTLRTIFDNSDLKNIVTLAVKE